MASGLNVFDQGLLKETIANDCDSGGSAYVCIGITVVVREKQVISYLISYELCFVDFKEAIQKLFITLLPVIVLSFVAKWPFGLNKILMISENDFAVAEHDVRRCY